MTDLSTRSVGPKAAIRALRKAIKTRRPVFVWGPPGIGKSEIVAAIGLASNRPVIDVRLALWEPTDIKGIPYFNSNQNKMVWAPPAELPTDSDSDAIIFLDELNSAPPAVQAAAYQLILNRAVGTYELPKKVDIVAAGNREGDRGVTYRMPSPLANRFIHLDMQVDFDDWQDWAVQNDIHPDVVGYISFAKQDLYDFDPKGSSKAFATPRSWTYVSDLLKDDDGDIETLHNLIAGAVGDGLAIKFMAHRKIASHLPKPSDILDGKVKELKVKEISAMYSLTTALCYELKDRGTKRVANYDEMVDNYFNYMMDNFTTEIVVMGARVALTTFNIPMDASNMRSFDRFNDKFGKYVLAACS